MKYLLSLILIGSTIVGVETPLFAQDRDGDGLEDVLENQLGTDIDHVDSDRDGLGDGYEVHVSMTDPNKRDSDDGGDWDTVELHNGFNPNDPNDETNLLIGGGAYAQLLRDGRSFNSVESAEISLIGFSYVEMRGFCLDRPIDFSESEPGDFSVDEPMLSMWGDPVGQWVGTFSGWLHIPAVQGSNTRTFAVACNEGCRFRIHDGEKSISEKRDGGFGRFLTAVDFPSEGGMFPFEIVYFSDDGDEALEFSWASGDRNNFSTQQFSLVPHESIVAPNGYATQSILDLNGGLVEPGDILEVTVHITNPSQFSLYSVSASARKRNLLQRSFSLEPDGSRTFSDVITFPIIDPGETKTYKYIGEVPTDATTFEEQTGVLGSLVPNGLGQNGRNRIRFWSDDPSYSDAIDQANGPSAFSTNGNSDDDPNIVVVGEELQFDECVNNTAVCDPNANCIDEPKGYSCECKSGFTGDGASCVEVIEECQCGENQTCVDGQCVTDECQCTSNETCVEGRCVSDQCDDLSCPANQICAGGTCFDSCAADVDCSNPDHLCFEERCTLSPCDGISCGADQICFGGGCFNACDANGDCQDGEACYDGRCAINPCRRVVCGTGDVCYGGGCFATCFEDADCGDGTLCYEGRCTADPCLEVSCPAEQVCYGGSCFVSCDEDVDCSNPNELCYDFRCTSDPCEGVQCPSEQMCVEGYCRSSCSASNPCEMGLDCEQGLCVPTHAHQGCSCTVRDPSEQLPAAIFLFGVVLIAIRRRATK